VTFAPIGKQASARADETLLDVARRAGVPVANSCGAVGVCARCVVRVLDGAAALSPMTTIEARVTRDRKCAPDERLACQAIVGGDCTVTTTYWSS
jgi:ferredoxin